MNSNNYYSCSSWNYGSYAPTNPCFIQQFKSSTIMNQNRYIPQQNNYCFNKFGKRALPEEERIVTNEYMQAINHMKKMEKSKNLFRIKSSHGMSLNSSIKDNNN